MLTAAAWLIDAYCSDFTILVWLVDDGFNSQGKGPPSPPDSRYSAPVNTDHSLPAHEQV